ncbi:hypothetical protein KIN20_004208 [Parelaphostrongylus tenuis]|uniref:Uncharacterized protein n=1 Tax=Parelaphostrongylus tenuis TaxID=148309 RepID=A0AAD5MJE7_PARTN|nr:hypothetical protein KIN20_004208 [Parelaphostrongylus tenuis]
MLGRSQVTLERPPRTLTEEGQGTAEEEREINDIILTEDETLGRKYSNATRCVMKDQLRDCGPVTSVEAIGESTCLPSICRTRMDSRYDNMSCSSNSEYVSVASTGIVTPERTSVTSDSTSIATTATTNIYYSTYDISEEDEDECSEITVKAPVKSVSAYNLPTRTRKRSMIFKSFDRELDTVLEHTTPEQAPRMIMSSTELDDQTPVIENEKMVTTKGSTASSSKVASPTRISRHRPLQVVSNQPTLAIFQVSNCPSYTKVV